jgi:uncharacterized MAPEG superfamily protein
MDLFHSTAFGTYSLFAIAISTLLLSVDMFGGVLLPRTKNTLTTRGEGTDANGVAIDGPARVMAAHRNAVANIVPFLFVMLLDVLLGASTRSVIILCGVFAAMRFAHAIAHIRGIQPWRTIVWLAAQLCLFVGMFQVVHAAIALV